VGLGLRPALDEGVGRGQRGRVRGVLEEPPFAVEAPDVEGQPGGREEHGQREGEDHEHLASLGSASSLHRATESAPNRRHQLMTIVTSPTSCIRPPASLGRSAEINGMTRSWWYVALTVICCASRVSESVTPLGTTYVITRSPFVKVRPLFVHVDPVANWGETLLSRFIELVTADLIDS